MVTKRKTITSRVLQVLQANHSRQLNVDEIHSLVVSDNVHRPDVTSVISHLINTRRIVKGVKYNSRMHYAAVDASNNAEVLRNYCKPELGQPFDIQRYDLIVGARIREGTVLLRNSTTEFILPTAVIEYILKQGTVSLNRGNLMFSVGGSDEATTNNQESGSFQDSVS